MRKIPAFLLLVLCFETGFAQRPDIIKADGSRLPARQVDTIVQRLMDTAGVTGLTIGIIQHNQPDFIKSYGYRNKTLNQPNTNYTSFYAASFSKSLFAYLVMQLVDKELINLDKPLYQYLSKPLPDYADYKDLAVDERWKLITARHCLAHTTGFPNWRFLNPNGNQKLEIFFTPGSRYAYSGEGIYLLQLVIENITGKDLETLAQEYIFRPLDMKYTSFTWQPSYGDEYANGHNYEADTFPIQKRDKPNAAGSMQTTIKDYTHFLSALMQGKGISEKSKQEMLSTQIGIFTKQQFPSLNNDTTSRNKAIQLSYGLGWGLFTTPYGRAFFKEGHSDDGWQHYLIAIPEKQIALVCMSNSMNAESIYKELVESITGVTIPWEWEGYTPYRPVVKLPVSTLAQYAGDYTGAIQLHISLENELLRVESTSEGVPKTGLYPVDENSFYMKLIPAQLEFIKAVDGKAAKLNVKYGDELFELTKKVPPAIMKPATAILNTYIGKYQLTGQSGTLSVALKKNTLQITLPDKTVMDLIFYSNSQFKANSIMDIKGEFVTENDKPVVLVIEQNGKYEWVKMK